MTAIALPFPAAVLAGHATQSSWAKITATKMHRAWAANATNEARPVVPESGDIHLHVIFIPPNDRGDRVNFPNRMKPYFDGIADALGVNDKRFLPSFEYRAPDKRSGVIVEVRG